MHVVSYAVSTAVDAVITLKRKSRAKSATSVWGGVLSFGYP